MNKILIVILALFLVLGGFYFYYKNTIITEDPNESSYITGYIYELSNEEILVAEGISSESYRGSINDLVGAAIWVNVEEETNIFKGEEKVSFSDIEIGMKVSVFIKGAVMESYPEQGTASRINIIEEVEIEECFVGGCSGEICSSSRDAISTCELLPGMECINKGMSCELVDGSCDWVLSEESATCFLEIEEEMGSSVRETRIGHFFNKAELFFR